MLTLDTGNPVGYAVWRAGRKWFHKCEPPYHAGVLEVPGSAAYQSRADLLVQKLRKMVREYNGVWWYVIAEYPAFFDTSKGHGVARRGDLVKLAFMCGALMSVAIEAGAQFHTVNPGTWKGQLSKPNVERRIKRTLGDGWKASWKEHAWDAVGIGLWVKGHF